MSALKDAMLLKMLRELGMPIIIIPESMLEEEEESEMDEFESAFAERLSGRMPKKPSLRVVPRPS